MTTYDRIRLLLERSGDDELAALIGTRPEAHVGVGGGSRRIDLDGTPVFVKRIPLSELEVAHPRSTANLFGLPLFCQYGIGGPGFGAWRELSAAERDFAMRHEGHDAGYAAMALVNWLVTNVCGLRVPLQRNACVRRCAAGDIPAGVAPGVAAILARHAADAARMNDFYWQLFGGDVHAEYRRRAG